MIRDRILPDGTGSVGGPFPGPSGTWPFVAGIVLVALTLVVVALPAAGTSATQVGVSADCEVSERHPEPGEAVTLDASGSSDSADTFQYEKGDDDNTYETNRTQAETQSFTYEEGTYDPNVTAYNETLGAQDTASCGTLEVAANTPPDAALTSSPENPTTEDTVEFDASESTDDDGQVVEYAFDFDEDGEFDVNGESATASYAYDTAGTREVVVRVTDDDGDGSEATETVAVGKSLSAACDVSERHPEPGDDVTLNASESDAADSFEYDRGEGDGEYDTGQLDSETHTFTYEEEGEYQPRVRAHNESRETSAEADCGTLEVALNMAPSASFDVTPSSPETGETVTFDGVDSTDDDGTIVEFSWDFDGDGIADESTADPESEHVYDDSGEYDATLTVEDDDGATATAEVTVEVDPSDGTPTETDSAGTTPTGTTETGDSDDLVARCSLWDQRAETGERVTVDATDSENADAVALDVDGDGTYERREEGSFLFGISYDETGSYEPRVRAIRGENADTADCGTITVESGDGGSAGDDTTTRQGTVATASATAAGDQALVVGGEATAGERVTLDATRVSDEEGIVAYRWDLDGNGAYERSGREVTHTFSSAGDHEVGLQLAREDGAVERRNLTVQVAPSGGPLSGVEGFALGLLAVLGVAAVCGAGIWLYQRRQQPPWV